MTLSCLLELELNFVFLSCKTLPSPETGDFEVRDSVDPVESSVQELLHSMIRSFMDSVVTNINVRKMTA